MLLLIKNDFAKHNGGLDIATVKRLNLLTHMS